ncbi:hypothetical protein Q3G72_000183 [Acer saccharum]|nr:hypothetical protein Q3G72_000183 [Acer saccharum]
MRGAGAPDFFHREAQRLGYLARSAFKLLQIHKQYKLIKPGSSIHPLLQGLKVPIAKISGSNQLKSKGLRMKLPITQPDDWHLHLRDVQVILEGQL